MVTIAMTLFRRLEAGILGSENRTMNGEETFGMIGNYVAKAHWCARFAHTARRQNRSFTVLRPAHNRAVSLGCEFAR